MAAAPAHFAQFAWKGTATPLLQHYIDDANPANVKVVGKGKIHCDGLTRCLRPLGKTPFEQYGISTINDTTADCARTSRSEINVSAGEGETTYLERYSGRCALTSGMVGLFLVECRSDAKDYIFVHYGKSESYFEAYGGAKALFSKRPDVKVSELKKKQTTEVSKKDIRIHCPKYMDS